LSIRELVKHDLDQLIELYLHLHTVDTPMPERQQIERVWNDAICNDCIKYLGKFIDEKLVSSCAISIIPNLTRSCRPYGVIENVVTHGEFRRLGYGKAVLSAALASAWAKNCYKVTLMTGKRNESTISFYESAGFKRNVKEAYVAVPDSL